MNNISRVKFLSNLKPNLIKFDDKLLDKANELIEQVSYYLKLKAQAMKNGAKPFPPSQFLAITNAALAAQKLGKISMGEITENINVNSTIKEADAFNSIMELYILTTIVFIITCILGCATGKLTTKKSLEKVTSALGIIYKLLLEEK